MDICKVWKNGLTLGRAGAGKSNQSSTKKLICFYGGTESLPPHLHLVALRSGRRGDTPPVGRQDALLKATVGGGGEGTRSRDSPTPTLPLPPAEETGCQVGLRHIIFLYPLGSSVPIPLWTLALWASIPLQCRPLRFGSQFECEGVVLSMLQTGRAPIWFCKMAEMWGIWINARYCGIYVLPSETVVRWPLSNSHISPVSRHSQSQVTEWNGRHFIRLFISPQ